MNNMAMSETKWHQTKSNLYQKKAKQRVVHNL